MPKTGFRPETDGFAFVNSWTFDATESQIMRDLMRAAIDAALHILTGPFALILRAVGADRALAEWIASGVTQQYGLCAGMSFTALDYYKAGLVLPRGTGYNDRPERTTPEGTRLRDYLWRRQMDDNTASAATFLAWMLVLHLVPKEVGGGHPWLRARSWEQWAQLKAHIDAGDPWPIGLLRSGKDPFGNHAVLAYGYDDPGDGTGTIYIYEVNRPGGEQTIRLDFRGEMLDALESCPPGPGWTPIRAFACESYGWVPPPVAVGLAEGLTATPPDRVTTGDPVEFRFTARNYSFSATPALALYVQGRPEANPGEILDPGGEGARTSIPFGSSRQLVKAVPLTGTTGRRRFATLCHLGSYGGIEVFKTIPAVEANTTATLGIEVSPPAPPPPWNLLLYSQERQMGAFYAADAQGNLRFLREQHDLSGWTHIVRGRFGGSGGGDLLFYDRDTGQAAFWIRDRQGDLRLLREHRGWSAWTDIIPGEFGGSGFTDLLFYDRGTSTGAFCTTDGQGDIQLLKEHRDWTGWTRIVPGYFSDSGWTDLLFYNGNTGLGAFRATDGQGNIRALREHRDWFGWTHIIPGDFSDSPYTDLLFYNANNALGSFWKTDGQGNIVFLREHGDWTGWTHITPGAVSGGRYSDLLFYNRNTGVGSLWSTDGQGNIACLKEHRDWANWTHVVLEQLDPRPRIVVQPKSHDFGDVPPGGSDTAGFEVANPGELLLRVRVSRPDPPFAITRPLPDVINPSHAAQLEVSCTPEAEGLYGSEVAITSNAYNAPLVKISLIVGRLARCSVLAEQLAMLNLDLQDPNLTPRERMAILRQIAAIRAEMKRLRCQ